jgi:hypothetical protein
VSCTLQLTGFAAELQPGNYFQDVLHAAGPAVVAATTHNLPI